MNAALLIAALTVAPGSPAERPVADFSADCFLGHWEGHESRLVLEHGAEVPSRRSSSGALGRAWHPQEPWSSGPAHAPAGT